MDLHDLVIEAMAETRAAVRKELLALAKSDPAVFRRGARAYLEPKPTAERLARERAVYQTLGPEEFSQRVRERIAATSQQETFEMLMGRRIY